jgi:hypothetical protein
VQEIVINDAQHYGADKRSNIDGATTLARSLREEEQRRKDQQHTITTLKTSKFTGDEQELHLTTI